jgi:hypothetical protein
VYDLLLAKQAELDTRRGAIGARMDYWLARTELERLTAGPLPEGGADTDAAAPPRSDQPQEQTGEHEHHHEE